MTKTAFIITFSSLILLTACNDYSNQYESKNNFQFFTFKDKIDWTKVEANISDKEKNEITQNLKTQFGYFFEQAQFDSTEYGLKGFAKCLHFLDINGDKKTDVIFEGYSGGESDFTNIFINENGKFKSVIAVFQYLKALNFDNNGKLNSFTILDFGCCAEYIETETTYSVDENFKTSILFQRAKPSFTSPPKQNIFSTPIKFKTINDDYTLRSSPIIDDTSTIIYDAIAKGNAIAKYPKNSIGYAWTEQQDNTGQTWYLVEMNPVKKLKEDLVYYRDTIAPRQIGWMNKRYLQIEN